MKKNANTNLMFFGILGKKFDNKSVIPKPMYVAAIKKPKTVMNLVNPDLFCNITAIIIFRISWKI